MKKLEWIRKLNYLGHSIGGSDKLISLDPNELIDTAKSTTGLSDFGDDDWKPNFHEKINHCDRSESIHILGRLQFRANYLRYLRNRLFITDKIKLQPAILNESIDAPLIIIGIPRTGTTHLFGLLSQDPSFRSPYCFEAVSPVEPPPDTITGSIDRKKIAQGCFDFQNDLLPELKTMYFHQHDLPEECNVIMSNVLSFKLPPVNSIGDYQTFVKEANRDYSYRWHKKVLQLLQHEHPTKCWLLKCTTHINHMELVLKHYPNARIIHTHRDPVKSIPSVLSVAKNHDILFTLEPESSNFEKNNLHYDSMYFEGSLRKVISQRQEGIIPEKQIFDIHMQNLISDPITVIRAAYDYFGIDFSETFEKRILNYLAENLRYKHGKHNYQPENFGLTNKKIREQFRFYTDYYKISLGI